MTSQAERHDIDLMSELNEKIAMLNVMLVCIAKDKRAAQATVQEVYRQLEIKIQEAFESSTDQLEAMFEKNSNECHNDISELCDLQKRYII